MIGQAISRNSLLLGMFAVVTTGVIAATYLGTKDRIAEQIRAAREKALLEIVSADRHNNAMLEFPHARIFRRKTRRSALGRLLCGGLDGADERIRCAS